jgi:Fic family protein
MNQSLKIISSQYFEEYSSKWKSEYNEVFKNLSAKPSFTVEDFEHYLIASSLYSSKIEGNSLDVNSFFRNRGKIDSVKKKEVQEIEDLVLAYKFATDNHLNKSNFLKTHAILSKTFLPAKNRGKVRKEQVGIRDANSLKPIYLAVEAAFVNQELDKLFSDISELLSTELRFDEVFYYASMIHVWVAKIHPFMDGNGPTARLIEKWFLASKIGIKAWSIPSEKFYWDHRPEYYQNIALGFNYYALHWQRSIPFLFMLPNAMLSE